MEGFSYFIVDENRNNWLPAINIDDDDDLIRGNDYIIDAGKFIVYISNSENNIVKFESNNLLFRKRKIYKFRDGKVSNPSDIVVATDELENKFNICDIWHSVFFFIRENDLLKAERMLKLNKIEQ